jgi:dimethylamine/trimethylamine dehydrogenase
VFDDDHAYMGGLLAEVLASSGLEVTLATPVGEASSWTYHTAERERANGRLVEVGVTVITNQLVTGFDGDCVELRAVYGAAVTRRPAAALVMVTARIPDDGLYYDLMADEGALTAAGIKSVTRVGDCLAPGTIAAAVHSGHAHARALDEPDPGDVPFKRERVVA